MPLSPDEIEAAYLPRARLGGYKAGPTAALLRRVSWDYRQIVHQHRAVAEEVRQLRVRIAELEQELQEAQQAVSKRRDPDELTRVVLAAAQRTAREVREAAKQEAETTLRKARSVQPTKNGSSPKAASARSRNWPRSRRHGHACTSRCAAGSSR